MTGTSDRPTTDRLETGRPPTDRPITDHPAGDHPAGGPTPRPAADTPARRASGAAARLLPLVEVLTGTPAPLRLRAWDGSTAGPPDAPTLVLRSRRALRRLLWQPDELGLAQAYVSGDLDVEGDLRQALRTVREAVEERGRVQPRPGTAFLTRAALTAARLGAVGPRPGAPQGQARLHGTPHTRTRDRAAISHHYDLSNEFYELLLDPSMAYSCAYWTRTDPGYSLADAQHDKLELICRKLELRPGMRLLDVGCGWGALVLHAARHHGVHAVGVTLAAEQAGFVRERVRQQGLGDRVEIRHQHWRDVEATGFDAVTTVEMGEHVGDDHYPDFARQLRRALAPGGHLLLQQMSRGAHAPGGGAFIESFIAPDMHMRPLGATVSLLEEAGFEIRDVQGLREHYVATVDAWHETLERRREEVTALVGPVTARVWRLYLVGGSLAFEQGRMGVDQVLAQRPGASPSRPRTRSAR
ncbi:class I SAM-dependent methyltransferase [Streptacidiphilus jiangxiensis]|uniref:Cyclopropane-fatty-acyl-phospholipid synthase n=1 Tax=Streptacidiphilus jiangxiensis TaxID=235985 RepID=A0A1H7N3A2_STRJI|nr:cyclopropane-fatty-acyl-phospholipid synthase family protein [Streptacidiphilus jiangxiensis]SEL17943.1 cyclopropane-fatty-acyl-phospholipid synthase [Streptacidiphilus jiangxiensis]